MDPGFGSKSITQHRLVDPSGRYNIKRKGSVRDLYKYFVEIPILQLVLLLFFVYIILNFGFASLYFFGSAHLQFDPGYDGINGFWQCLYFSFQTFTTVGYGHLFPSSPFINVVAAIEAYTGLVFFAIATGLSFSRFSSPGRFVLFSDVALIRPYEQGHAFMFRVANKSNSKMVDVSANLLLTYVDYQSVKPVRKYLTLPLQIDKIILFPLNWTLVHVIDQRSWLYEKSLDDLLACQAEFLVMLRGHDDTYSKTVLANRSYTSNEIQWDVAFDIMYQAGDRQIELDLGKINSTTPLH